MKLTIKIACDNEAFSPAPEDEIARILRVAANKIAHGADRFPLVDVNGNTVGDVRITR